MVDAVDMTRTQLKEMENEYQFIEENLEKKLENETQLTKKYVDTRIDAFQKHGISGTRHLSAWLIIVPNQTR